MVHAASLSDSAGGRLVLEKLKDRFPRLQLFWADQGYKRGFVEWAKQFGAWIVEIVQRQQGQKGFSVLPRRWVVERTIAWLMKHRRLSKDYEALPQTSEAWIHLAMIHLMVRRLA